MFKQDWQAVADEAQRKAKARKAGTPKKDEKKSTPLVLFSSPLAPSANDDADAL